MDLVESQCGLQSPRSWTLDSVCHFGVRNRVLTVQCLVLGFCGEFED